MAKGDKSRQQNQLDYQTKNAQNTLSNTRDITGGLQQTTTNNYQQGVNNSFQNYDQLMNMYQNFLGTNRPNSPNLSSGPGGYSGSSSNQMPATTADGSAASIRNYLTSHGGTGAETDYWVGKWPELQARGQQLGDPNYAVKRLSQAEELGGGGQAANQGPAFGGYQEFSQTGGFSPQQIQDLRARAIAPTRAIYQNAQNELSRQRELSGYMPNFAAAQNRLTRESANAIGDQNVNANASIAQAIQQGRLAGLSGMTGIDQFGRTLGFNQQQLAQQGDLANRGMNLQGINAMTGLYGQQPGLAQMYGNQALTANQQGIDVQQLQQALAGMAIGGQNANAQIPGNFQQALGNIGSVLGLGGQVAGAFSGIPGMFGGGVAGLPGRTQGYF